MPSDKEMKATKIIKIPITEASAKIRKGTPVDDKADYTLPIWAGVVPLNTTFGEPIADLGLNDDIPIPFSVKKLLE